jgi:hypothetical protein
VNELLDIKSEDSQKALGAFTVKETIAFGQYFARSRIQYLGGNVPQTAVASARSRGERVQSGDAKMYASLTAYIIDQVIRPVNANLTGWYFGVIDDQRTKHRYMTAIKPYRDGIETRFAVLYFDPVMLDEQPLSSYTNVLTDRLFGYLNFEKVMKTTDVLFNRNQYLYLERYTEDIIKHAIDPDMRFKPQNW